MERKSRIKGARAWAVQGWVTSSEDSYKGGEELQSSECSGLPSAGMRDLLGR